MKLKALLNPALALLLMLLPITSAAAAEGTTAKTPPKAEFYVSSPQPMTPVQCGQCHESHYTRLKEDGGRHRFDCQGCHRVFHAYNPTKGIESYRELMPKCSMCHDLPHGKGVTDCAGCHNDPHAIKKPVMGARLANACPSCHPGPKAQLTENPSRHSKVACERCHTSHGFKPNCNMCHKPHYPAQAFDSCTKCHPVHEPTLVSYAKELPNATCVACHAREGSKLKNTPSKHATVSCASCHKSRHKAIPKCTECHQSPHPKVFLDMYPTCLECHLDPHDPSVGIKTKK